MSMWPDSDCFLLRLSALLDDLDKELNNYIMRCREWYGWHFPELGKIVTDNLAYCKAVRKIGTNLLHFHLNIYSKNKKLHRWRPEQWNGEEEASKKKKEGQLQLMRQKMSTFVKMWLVEYFDCPLLCGCSHFYIVWIQTSCNSSNVSLDNFHNNTGDIRVVFPAYLSGVVCQLNFIKEILVKSILGLSRGGNECEVEVGSKMMWIKSVLKLITFAAHHFAPEQKFTPITIQEWSCD